MSDERPGHVLFEEQRGFELHDPDPFDRVAYAMRLLALLRPPRMTVAVYSSTRALRVERGVELGSSEGSCVLLGVPPHATRESIAVALADLVGGANRPFVVDLLLRARG